eukprot:CAMPEP_0203664032 /NCGR_PEP_ID=MMETSP0090-20130426/1529_1 /ASSEMBLY_ACC=CAM_ASM_001088 /TAXON_ID=426623 /ORGANISM="Chaetoceros affinis, Strain CCMP159" /LENGTH=526 /DNA_ID=CAMNT_0050527131 /DNA_START=80 /DNA_END=1660 /DNA_ORIENTATION=-
MRRGGLVKALTPSHNGYNLRALRLNKNRRKESQRIKQQKTRKGDNGKRNRQIATTTSMKQERQQPSRQQKRTDDAYSQDNSLQLSPLLSSLHETDQSFSTPSTAEMSIPNTPISTTEKPQLKFEFDFDPAVVLDLGIVSDANAIWRHGSDNNVRMNSRRYSQYSLRTDDADAATDVAVEHVRDLSEPSKHDAEINHMKENHNQYLARRYNRQRIERCLDFLCPPDSDDDCSISGIIQRRREKDEKKQTQNIQPQSQSEEKQTLPKRPMTKEGNQSLEKSFLGFSLDPALGSSAAILSKSDQGDERARLNTEPSKTADQANINTLSLRPLLERIPTSIDVTFDNDADESVLSGNESDSSQRAEGTKSITSSQKKQSPQYQAQIGCNQGDIKPRRARDTNCSPTGVDDFDETSADFDLHQKLNEPTIKSSVPYTSTLAPIHMQTTQALVQRIVKDPPTEYSPNQTIIQLKSKLNNLTPNTSSRRMSVSYNSVASPTSYNSANILKIKSRLRQIESDYKQIRTCVVQNV